jgi:hypothetical protein
LRGWARRVMLGSGRTPRRNTMPTQIIGGHRERLAAR